MAKSQFPLTQMMLDMMDVPVDRLLQTDVEALAKHYRVKAEHAAFYLDEALKMQR